MSNSRDSAVGCAASPPSQAGLSLLGLPFDTLRALYATGVQAGLIRRSMLESRDFERVLASAERFMLGPLARNN
ncbi:MAG: hypothetical protein Q7S90_09265 [Rubrivivax sp.]|nr:hypothetical protein [Rubrivivax sp.]